MLNENPVGSDRLPAVTVPFRKPIFLASALITFALLAAGAVTAAVTVCVTAAYTVVTTSAPPTANWTDTSGALWVPSGGFPGCAPGDSAADTNVSPTTIIINSVIPNPIVGLNLACSGCVIDIQPGGQLSLAGPGFIGNGATLMVSGGTLSIAAGGTLAFQSGSQFQFSSGLVDLQSGGLIDFQTGSNGQSTGGVLSGAGTLSMTGGTLNIGSVTSPGTFVMTAGTLTGPGFLSIANSMTWSGGTLTGTGGTELAGGGTGTFDGAAGNMVLDGRSFNNYGYVSYTVPADSSTLQLSNGAVFNTYYNFVITDDGSINTSGSPSSFNVFPNGLLLKANGSGTSTIYPNSTNNSNVFGSAGTLEFAGDNTNSGGFVAFAPGTIKFSASSSVFDASSVITGDGTVRFSAGTAQISGGYDVGSTDICGGTVDIQTSAATTDFKFTSGTLTVEQDFTMYGTGTWSGGTMGSSDPDAYFDVAPGATLTIDAATGSPTDDFLLFANDGTVYYTASSPANYLTFTNDALIDNTGLFDIQTDVQIASTSGVIILGFGNHGSTSGTSAAARAQARAARMAKATAAAAKRGHPHLLGMCACPGTNEFDNSGTLQKTAGTGTMDFGPILSNTTGAVNALTGTMNFLDVYDQSAGSTTLGPGNISVASALDLHGGVLNGAGTLTGNLNNSLTAGDSGKVTPAGASSIGTITVTGNYEEGLGASLDLEIASASSYDVLAVSGSVTPAGTLNVTLLSGYQPANGVTFMPLTFSSKTGDFATKNLPTWAGTHGSMSPTYTGTALVLTAVVTPTSADLSLGMTGPASVNAGAALSYTATVTNNGPDPSSGTISVANTLPAGATAASGSGTGWSCGAPSGGAITCTSTAAIASLGTSQITFSMTAPPDTASISNSATVSSSFDSNGANNSAFVNTTVVAQADLSITKTGPTGVAAGNDITYNLSVTNNGPSQATGVQVDDQVTSPASSPLTFVPGGGTCGTGYPCMIGTINAGTTVSFQSVFHTSPSYSGNVTNMATVTTTTAGLDPASGNNSMSFTTNIGPQSDLQLTMTGPPSANAGQNVTYTIKIDNFGPSQATNLVVTDVTPVGLALQTVSGGGCSAFPCTIATLAVGSQITITATYSIPGNYSGGAISNTASVSSGVNDPGPRPNSATVTTPIGSGSADLAISKSGPGDANPNSIVDFTIFLFNNGPSSGTGVVVNDPTPAGLAFVSNSGGCSTPFPCNLGTVLSGQLVTITARYVVQAAVGSTITNTASASSSQTDPVLSNNSSSVTLTVSPALICPQPPILTAPAGGATVTSPVTFSWSGDSNASSYVVVITGASTTQTLTTTSTSLTQALVNGSYSWSAQAVGAAGCPPATSGPSSFLVCNAPDVPVLSVVGLSSTGQTYSVQWTPADGTTSYELQEATEASFSSPASTTLGGTAKSFTKNVQSATAFFYRVRAVGGCSQSPGTFSAVASVVVIPLPPLGTLGPNIPVPSGSTQPVTFPIHVPGLPGVTTSFFATVDKPWLAVTPSSGLMPPEGVTFTISADPSSLNDGTWTGTVIIVFGSGGVSGKTALDVAPKTSIPVSISLTTPVSPGTLSGPSASAVVIPSVGHLAGLGSQWQSDIRIANITALSKKVQLTFSGGSATSLAVKQATITIDPGATTALDDVVRNWFGVGALGDSSNGVLTVQPLDATGKPDPSVTKATIASSRTFNTSALGTLGQFIPAVPLSRFISSAAGANSILALQQIAQNDTYRTNLGLVEATGKPASALISVFNGSGSKILDLPVSLAAGEQRQLNSFMAGKGITLTNGHIEVQATSGEGKITAYASVIDSRSSDPLLVSGVPIGGTGASRFVIPGVASLDTTATWRSDVRIFNSSLTPQTTTLTLFPTGNPSASVSRDVTIQPGEVKALDDIVHATFNLTNSGGALHVTTAVAVPLVVTARTYDDTSGGTLGQFVQAVTSADAVGSGERSLQLLQMEDSPRYRTNLGLAEVTGKAVTAEVTVVLPDSKVAPKVQIPLAAFEYRQFPIISVLGLGNTYNARITVRVIDGQGKITAYGSVIDQKTQDPTFVPAQ